MRERGRETGKERGRQLKGRRWMTGEESQEYLRLWVLVRTCSHAAVTTKTVSCNPASFLPAHLSFLYIP